MIMKKTKEIQAYLIYNKKLQVLKYAKEYGKNKTEFFMNFLYSNFYETEKNKKETIKILILDIIQTEKTIQLQINFYNKK